MQACAVSADQIVFALAIGGHQVGRDVEFMKLFAGADHALWTDHPLQLHGDQFRALADHRFETGIVVCQTLNLVVLRLVQGRDIVEPQRGTDQLVAQPQGIKHFSPGLADGHGALRGMLKCQRRATVLYRQWIVGGSGQGQGRHAQGGGKGGGAVQHHDAISIWIVHRAGAYGLETHR